ncbi:IS200/IS605 family transposase [Odoribacter sp. OttesenSCG-928-L07]|nr:IS200/IS605 family transposase [Odoribacter sp. OttesenSCG-928-L07]MDL2238686.1 IS200/IS605 family transposase [Bacteroidales bacterium OttesenSCG-928-L14]
MSYTQSYYHIVLRTKYSQKSISQTNVSELYRYIWGIIKNKKCKLYRINGIEDHIHLLISLHPSIALSDFVKDIKIATHYWMRKRDDFKQFNGWCVGYGAFTCGYRDRMKVIKYIANQQKHHNKESSKDEIVRIIKEAGIDVDDNDAFLR